MDFTIKFLVLVTVFLGILTLLRPDLFKLFFEFVKWVVEQLWYWNLLIVFISSMLESFPILGMVVPGTNIMIIVWWFFAQLSGFNLGYTILFASIWAIIWNFFWYFLWRNHGEKFLRRYGLWIGFGTTEAAYLKSKVHTWWPWGVIFWKFHNGTRALLPFVAGSMHMSKISFHFFNIIGSFIRATSMIFLWVFFARYYETILDYVQWIFLVVILSYIGYFYFFKRDAWNRYWEMKNEEIDQKLKDDYQESLKKHRK